VWLVVYRCYVATLGVSIFFTVCVIVSKRFFWQAVNIDLVPCTLAF